MIEVKNVSLFERAGKEEQINFNLKRVILLPKSRAKKWLFGFNLIEVAHCFKRENKSGKKHASFSIS